MSTLFGGTVSFISSIESSETEKMKHQQGNTLIVATSVAALVTLLYGRLQTHRCGGLLIMTSFVKCLLHIKLLVGQSFRSHRKHAYKSRRLSSPETVFIASLVYDLYRIDQLSILVELC